MSIKTSALGAFAGVFAFAAIMGSAVAADRPYAEGTVSVVTSIRTEPGQGENYMKYLVTTYRQRGDSQGRVQVARRISVYDEKGPHAAGPFSCGICPATRDSALDTEWTESTDAAAA